MAANLIPTPSPPPYSLSHHRNHHYTAWSHTQSSLIKPFKSKLTPLCSTPSSSSSSSVVKEETSSSPLVSQPETSIEDANKLPFRGCKACGREEIEKGCNGEGRIQGGIATVPGFGWWPIKAFRPCPGLVESGGRYRRRGQSMDEVAWGRSEMEATTMSIEELNSRYPGKAKVDIEKACPVTLWKLQLQGLLESRYRIAARQILDVKLQRLLYLLHGILPLLKQINKEQDYEIGIEAKVHSIKSADVKVARAQLHEKEGRYWYAPVLRSYVLR